MFNTPQFILWKAVPNARTGKTDKFPIHPLTGVMCDAHDPGAWVEYQTAHAMRQFYSHTDGIGFVFTSSDPYFFLDIDGCNEGGKWSSTAITLLQQFPGAYIEVSQSGNGLHIIGRYDGQEPAHSCRNADLHLELYTSGRFVALTERDKQGNADTVFNLAAAATVYFPATVSSTPMEWTDKPCREWNGLTDDQALIKKALASNNSGFSNKCSFRQLWEADAQALSIQFPSATGIYDESGADAALAAHLAFWTGRNCERIQKLMCQSSLYRSKYNREDYLPRTILKAISDCVNVYGKLKLRAKSETERLHAEEIRTRQLSAATDEQFIKLYTKHGLAATAEFWERNSTADIQALINATMSTVKAEPLQHVNAPERKSGEQYAGTDEQIAFFSGCVYITNEHRIFTPTGERMKPEQFNVNYGGRIFQLDEYGHKTTRKAWEAFTENQCVSFPKVSAPRFNPQKTQGEIFVHEGLRYVNTYVPYEPRRMQGDIRPFINHVAKMLPDEHDRTILLSYLAAACQYKGVKFQWAPLLQGCEGNGKSFFTRIMTYCLGSRYVHPAKADQIDSKFNGWLADKLLITFEDIAIGDNKTAVLEILKPMITNRDQEVQKKGADQMAADICANFIFNSNHKDALRKTEGDRRFAIFYTAHQTAEDLIVRDGMDEAYFKRLYDWFWSDGCAIIAEYLYTYPIPEDLNPAGFCQRAPRTSSHNDVIRESLGMVEQVIAEAIGEGRTGFKNGWISSIALDSLLKELRRNIPVTKRTQILQDMGYELHKALTNDGRTNGVSMVSCDYCRRPKLYIKSDHPSAGLTTAADVLIVYTEGQK